MQGTRGKPGGVVVNAELADRVRLESLVLRSREVTRVSHRSSAVCMGQRTAMMRLDRCEVRRGAMRPPLLFSLSFPFFRVGMGVEKSPSRLQTKHISTHEVVVTELCNQLP